MEQPNIDFDRPLQSSTNYFTIIMLGVLIPFILVVATMLLIAHADSWLSLLGITFFGVLVLSILIAQVPKYSITLTPSGIEILHKWKKQKVTILFSEVTFLEYYKNAFYLEGGGRNPWRLAIYTSTERYCYSEYEFENLKELHRYIQHYVPEMPPPSNINTLKKSTFLWVGLILLLIGVLAMGEAFLNQSPSIFGMVVCLMLILNSAVLTYHGFSKK